MLNLRNFRWSYDVTGVVFELEFATDYWPDLAPDYFLTKLAGSSSPLQYNYFEIALLEPFDGNSGKAYIQLAEYIPISSVTHPLQILFASLSPEFTEVPSIKASSFSSAAEAYEHLISNTNQNVYHLKHYPLRGNGRFHTLSSMQTLNLTKKELIQDEPFNILDFKIFNEYFGYNGNHGGNGHQGSCSYVLGQTGMLPSGVYRKIS